MKFEDAEGNYIEIDAVDERLDPVIALSTKNKAGGGGAMQVSGERIRLVCKARATIAEYRTLINLLKNGSRRYYYTPEETYALWSTVDIPFAAIMSDLQSSWDNRNVHYITFTIESVDLQ